MGLRRIPPQRSWTFNGGRPARPKAPRSVEFGRFLVSVANARAGRRVDPGDGRVKLALERGFITVERQASYSFSGRHAPTSHHIAKITEDGWRAVWEEDIGAPRPTPKSERVEKRARHV